MERAARRQTIGDEEKQEVGRGGGVRFEKSESCSYFFGKREHRAFPLFHAACSPRRCRRPASCPTLDAGKAFENAFSLDAKNVEEIRLIVRGGGVSYREVGKRGWMRVG